MPSFSRLAFLWLPGAFAVQSYGGRGAVDSVTESGPHASGAWFQPTYYASGQGYGCLAGHNEGGRHQQVADLDGCKALCINDPLCQSIDYYDSNYGAGSDLCNIGYAQMTDASQITDTLGCNYYSFDRTASEQTAAAVGDPHLTNIYGQRFDLKQPGLHAMLSIPRGAAPHDALLRVNALAIHEGHACSDVYFKTINFTGRWVDAARARDGGSGGDGVGVQHCAAQRPSGSSTGWTTYGAVDLKVVWGRTSGNIVYLNLFVRNLRSTGRAVGGLLGEDDHSAASTPPPSCEKMFSLSVKSASRGLVVN